MFGNDPAGEPLSPPEWPWPKSAVYASNNQVCPLTPLAEELGASSGQVADIFLPSWFSRRIPILSVGILLVGLAFNTRAWLASGRQA